MGFLVRKAHKNILYLFKNILQFESACLNRTVRELAFEPHYGWTLCIVDLIIPTFSVEENLHIFYGCSGYIILKNVLLS